MLFGAVIGIGSGTIQKREKIIIEDQFNRQDNATSLGVATSGQTWLQNGNIGIVNNQAYLSSGSLASAYIDSTLPDVSVYVTEVTTGEASRYGGLLIRYVDVNNYFRAVLQDNRVYFQKMEGGVTTTLGSNIVNRKEGSVLKVITQGPIMKVFVYNVLQLTISSTFNQSATRNGLISAALNARYDNFIISKYI